MSSKSEIKQVLANKGLRNISCVYYENYKLVYAENLRYNRNTDEIYDMDRQTAIPYDLVAGLRRKDAHNIEYYNQGTINENHTGNVTYNVETLFNIATIKQKIDEVLKEALQKREIRMSSLVNSKVYHGVDCVYYNKNKDKLLKGQFIGISDLGVMISTKSGKRESVNLEDIKSLSNNYNDKILYENKFFLHKGLELEQEKSLQERIFEVINRAKNILQQFLVREEEIEADQELEGEQEETVVFVSPKKSAAELMAEGKKERDKVEKELAVSLDRTVERAR